MEKVIVALRRDRADDEWVSRLGGPVVDRLLDLARAATDAEELTAIYRQVERILHEDQPYTFLWESMKVTATLPGERPIAWKQLS